MAGASEWGVVVGRGAAAETGMPWHFRSKYLVKHLLPSLALFHAVLRSLAR